MSPFDMPRFAPKLCCVPAQNGGGLTARDPGPLIKWFIAVVVIGVGVNLLSGFVVVQKWAWLPAAVFVAALLVAVPGGSDRSAGTWGAWANAACAQTSIVTPKTSLFT